MKIDKFTIIIIVSVLTIGGIAIYLAQIIFPGSLMPSIFTAGTPKPKSLSPYILYLTSPVFIFNGKVESITGSDLTVSQEVDPSLLVGVATTPSAVGKQVKISYRVRTDNETQFTQSPIFIPFLHRDITPPSPRTISLRDLKAGDSIAVYSKTDLRTIQNNVLDAIQITKNLASTSISGTITSVGANTIQVKSEYLGPIFTATPSLPPSTLYTVNIRPETEMVDLGPTGNKKISISDLKIGNQVMIYSATEINPGNPVVTAEKIDVISFAVSPILPTPPPVTTPLL